MKRVEDSGELHALVLENASEKQDIGPLEKVAEWLSDKRNIALQYGNDLGLFDYIEPGIYEAHCLCSSRGRQALNSIRRVLSELVGKYGAHTVHGHVTKAKLGDRWIFRQVGFKPLYEVEKSGTLYIFSVWHPQERPPSSI